MAGSKKAKLKKAFASASTSSPSNADDQELMDDLLAQLDSKDKQVQSETATIINDISVNAQNEGQGKRDTKSRFLARQVCRNVYATCSVGIG
jgi:OTU domain-containing protein 6